MDGISPSGEDAPNFDTSVAVVIVTVVVIAWVVTRDMLVPVVTATGKAGTDVVGVGAGVGVDVVAALVAGVVVTILSTPLVSSSVTDGAFFVKDPIRRSSSLSSSKSNTSIFLLGAACIMYTGVLIVASEMKKGFNIPG